MKHKYNILYVSTLCSPRLLNYLFKTSVIKPGLAIQKFHQLLVEGLAMNKNTSKVDVLSSIPIIHSSHKKRIWNIKSETTGKTQFNYVKIINLPVIKDVMVSIYSFIYILIWTLSKNRKNKIVICDALNLTITASTMFACKLTGTKLIAIVTDLPRLMVSGRIIKNNYKSSIYNSLVSYMLSGFDGYVLLTNQMNKVVNIHERPYIVIEGLVDIKMAQSKNLLADKPKEKILIYAGAINEEYGVKKLIEAFMRLEGNDIRLHLYGPGDMEHNMPHYMKKDKRIQYMGIVTNNIVVKNQLAATLLVNPRPSYKEFTKYSFPSKNLEYMVSGTPLVTTPLPGMPQEYNPFVYLFEDESVAGMYQTLKQLLSKPEEELHEFGSRAKQFVLGNKNNYNQASRITDLLIKFKNGSNKNRKLLHF